MNLKDINMDKLQSIEPGTVFRNRRAFCEAIDIQYVASGNTGRRQKERVNFLCSFTTQGHKIEVLEVYPEDVISANYELSTSEHGKQVELMILDLIRLHIEEGSEERMVVSLNSLIASLALANSEYFRYSFKGEKALTETLDLDKDYLETVSKWLRSTRSSFQYTIDKALKNLSDRRWIDVGTTYKIKDSTTGGVRVVSRSEHETVLSIETQVLKKLGFAKINEVYGSSLMGEFTKLTNELSEKLLGADFFFKCYQLTYARGALISMFSEESWQVNQVLMNKMMKDRLAKNIENKYKRNFKEDEGFNIITSSDIKSTEFRLLEYLIAIYNLEDDLGPVFIDVVPTEEKE